MAHAHVPRVRAFLTPSRSVSTPSGHTGCPAPFLITAGDDRGIRFWNLRRGIQHSFTLSGHGHRDRESSIYARQDLLSCCFEALDNPSNRLFSSSPDNHGSGGGGGGGGGGSRSGRRRSDTGGGQGGAGGLRAAGLDVGNMEETVGVAEGNDLTLDDSGRFRGPQVASGLHEDSILALNMLEPQGLLLSSSRDGAVKVWR